MRPYETAATGGTRGVSETALLSVVVHCFNVEEVINETPRRLSAALKYLSDIDYEIVYVDDGSKDRTPDVLKERCVNDGHVRVVRFSRNYR